MPILRAAAGAGSVVAGDAGVRTAAGEAQFDELIPAVRERLGELGGFRAIGWDGVRYLEQPVQEYILYGAGEVGEAPWPHVARVQALVEAYAVSVSVAQQRAYEREEERLRELSRANGGAGADGAGARGGGGGGGDGGAAVGHEDGVPRAVLRVDAIRWPAGLNFEITEAQYGALVKTRLPRPWVTRKHRLLFGELTCRAMDAFVAEAGSVAATRVLLALPRLALGNKHRAKQRCAGLLLGGASAMAVIAEALADAPTGGRGEGHDPLARAVQLAKLGRVVDALRAAAEADAEEVTATAAAAQEVGEPAAPRGPTRTVQELVAELLPAVREGQPPQELLDAIARIPSLQQAGERALLRIDWDAVLRALPLGKAAGIDGWRNEMLLSLLGAGRDMAVRIVEAVRGLAEAVYAGKVAVEARPLFAAARVAVIPKLDGSPRTLGVVGTLRRLVARPAVQAVMPVLTPWLVERGQFGVGAAAGTEALASAAQQAFEAGKAVIVMDRSNAYPKMCPQLAVAVMVALLPELKGLLEVLMSDPAWVMGDDFLSIFLGLFMGCPLSPALYAVALEFGIDAVRAMLARLGVDSRGFLDDGILAGADAENLRVAFDAVERVGQQFGQVMNIAKTKILVSEAAAARFADLLPGVQRVSHMLLVGVPVGADVERAARCVEIATKAKDARRKVGARILSMQSYYLLRKADGLPALVHMLRAVPPALSAEGARIHDEAVLQEVAWFAGAVPAELGVMGATTWLPLRKGGRAVASAVLVAGAAYVAAKVQIRRLEEQVGTVIPHHGAQVINLGRESGRPAPWWQMGVSMLCEGKAHCRMPKAEGCGNGCCRVCCCTTARGACAGCGPKILELRATAEVIALLNDAPVRDAVARATAAAGPGTTRVKVEDAFVAASVYRAPQRAMTCALLAVRCAALEGELAVPGREFEQRAWRACAAPSAYAVWLASPMAIKLSNGVFRVAMRMMFGLWVLSPRALNCKTKAGFEGKTCSLRGLKREEYAAYALAHPRAADEHALVCKCGGCQIHTHNGVCVANAGAAAEWGLPALLESRRYLPDGMRMDNEFPSAGDPCQPLMIDWTRRYHAGQADLSRAESAKETKYTAVYEAPTTMLGAAFNEYAELGPHAMQGVDRVVAAGVLTSGSHPADLKTEMLAKIGAAVLYGNAAAFAHFAKLNDADRRGYAPTKLELKPAGQRWAGGVTGRLAGRARRGRPRGPARAAPAARGARGAPAAAARADDGTADGRGLARATPAGGAGAARMSEGGVAEERQGRGAGAGGAHACSDTAGNGRAGSDVQHSSA